MSIGFCQSVYKDPERAFGREIKKCPGAVFPGLINVTQTICKPMRMFRRWAARHRSDGLDDSLPRVRMNRQRWNCRLRHTGATANIAKLPPLPSNKT